MLNPNFSPRLAQSARSGKSEPDPVLHRLQQLPEPILASLTPEQHAAVYSLLERSLPKPSPKIIDLRFVVDLLISRFYVVILVGKDRRTQQRRHVPAGVSRVGNLVAAIALLLSLNAFVSLGIFLLLYLLKSGVGIDIFPSHLSDFLSTLAPHLLFTAT